jgi:hypothetical protein
MRGIDGTEVKKTLTLRTMSGYSGYSDGSRTNDLAWLRDVSSLALMEDPRTRNGQLRWPPGPNELQKRSPELSCFLIQSLLHARVRLWDVFNHHLCNDRL